MLQESKLQNILAPFLSNGKFGKYLPFSESNGTQIFSFKKHGISECKLGLDIAKSFNPKISQFKQALIGIVFY